MELANHSHRTGRLALALLGAATMTFSGLAVTAADASGAAVSINTNRSKAPRGGLVKVRGQILGATAASATVQAAAQQPRAVRIFVNRGRGWSLVRRATARPDGTFSACAPIRVGRRVRNALIRAVTPVGVSRPARVRVARRARGGCGVRHRTATGGDVAENNRNVVLNDTAASSSPLKAWGKIDCQNDSRHRWLTSGGDPHATATGAGQGNSSFRRLTVFDGDDVWGERCELGLNDNRYSPTAIYKEGQRRITNISVRLPQGFPLAANTWQAVLQMKQAQPSANGSGTPVLEMDAYGGQWRLRQSNSPGETSDSRELWSAPAEIGQWTRFALDVTYSQYASKGKIRVLADLNGDGDFDDASEQSPEISTYTLKREISGGGNDGIAPGQSIPSHLRAGIYHNPSISCGSGCSVDIDNLQVVRP